MPVHTAEQWSRLLFGDAGGGDISIEVKFSVVVGGDFVAFTTFFMRRIQ